MIQFGSAQLVRTLSAATFLIVATGSVGAVAQTGPSERFYNVRLEPPAGRVLHGWGQFSSQWDEGTQAGAGDDADLTSYEHAVSPYRPALLSFRTALDESLMPQFAERYKQLAAQRGFFVAQLALYFQGYQRDASLGMRDPEIVMLLDTIRAARNPVLMRIGYEFNNPSAPYDPSLFIQAFRGIVRRIREAQLDNVATVWNASGAGLGATNFMRWYPGDDVVDWWGIDLFDRTDLDQPQLAEFLAKAISHRKPVVICEASPVFRDATPGQLRGPKSDLEAAAWYQELTRLIGQHAEIQAVAVISVGWRRSPSILPGSGWPDIRIRQWPKATSVWKKFLSGKRVINAQDAQAIYPQSR
ncbi:MAG: hypothetical protein JO121_02770 [Deltaproteobacteria bacterium]|nr:hypothetical protein [Deltaproteobacteria bacterium]